MSHFDRLQQIVPLCLEGNVAQTWKRWKQDFRDYLEATECDSKPDKVKLGLLKHLIGTEGKDVIFTLEFDNEDDSKILDKVLEKLDAYFNQRKTTLYDRFKVYTMEPHAGETIDHFLTRLKIAVDKGDFGNQRENILRDRIVFVQRDEGLKDRLFEKGDISLSKALEIIRGHETKMMKDQLLSDDTIINNLHSIKENRQNRINYITNCQRCGSCHEKWKCPAFGKLCNKCKKPNHFANVCRSSEPKQNYNDVKENQRGIHKNIPNRNLNKNKKIHEVGDTSQSDSDDVTIGHVKTIHSNCSSRNWYEDIMIGNTKVSCKLDTGAEVAVMTKYVYDKLIPKPELKHTKTILSVYGGEKLHPLGKIIVPCQVGTLKRNIKFVVIDKDTEPTLLGLDACENLGLIKRICPVNKISEMKIPTFKELSDKYGDVFNGVGCYEGEYHLLVDKNIKPVVHAPRKIPLSLHDKLKFELNQLEKQGILSEVDYPTDWVNSLLIIEKPNGELRLCIDPRDLNKALKREHYKMPTPDELLIKFNSMKYFTVLDLKSGFWNIKLDNESADLTTFNTPFGRYRFNRLPFGINVAPEIFQKMNDKLFGDLPGVAICVDDFLIGGETRSKLLENVINVLERAKAVNAKFNTEKIQYCKEEVKYLGRLVSGHGTTIDPNKVRAIKDLESPKDKHDLRRILGMVNYLMAYIPHLADLTAPLRELNKCNVEWTWNEYYENAFVKLKETVCNATSLVHFDSNLSVVIQADASKSGLGACLMQNGKPVMYTSRALTPTEQQYAQIEKELLSIVNACQKFHYYVYGRDIIVETDHKPLLAIVNKPFDKITCRLQRFVLKLQRYRLKLVYKPGKAMYIADTLSRNYLAYADSEEIYHEVHKISTMTTTSKWEKKIKEANLNDEEARELAEHIKKGWPENKNDISNALHSLWNYRHKFSLCNGIVKFDQKLFIPKKLRPTILTLLHESHLGIEKTKSLARQTFYWPRINQDIEELINSCAVCLKYRNAKPKEPLTPHPVSDYPWQKVGCDLFDFGNYSYLIIVDYFSKYPEVTKISNKTAPTVIKACKTVFARFGIPEIVMADNMPFNSYAFRSFAREWSFDIVTSSPHYPRSNGLAERNIQTIKQLLRKSTESGNDPELALLELRTTPIAGLKSSPAQLLMNRALRTRLPIQVNKLIPRSNHAVKQQLLERQKRQKYFHDKTARTSRDIETNSPGRVWNGKIWNPCMILGETEYPKSYNIVTQEGTPLRRTKHHLQNTKENFKVKPMVDDIEEPCPQQSINNSSDNICQETNDFDNYNDDVRQPTIDPVLRRSGRISKRPKFLEDYV